MANKLYLEENYVIWEIDGTPTGEYSKNHCVYRETTTSFIIKEEIDDGTANILKADVDAGNWLDGTDTPYTVAGLRTWLRVNSGFKTASGGSEAEFIMLVKTDNAGISASNQFIIPTTVGTYDYDVDWGDGNFSANVTGSVQHTYASAGTYTIKISGIFPRIQFNNSGDKLKLLEIQNWGNIAWGALNEAFRGCSNLDVTATDAPNLLNCTTLRQAFRDCSSLVGNSSFNTWDLSSVGNLDNTFLNCVNLNIDVPDWDVSNVIDFGFTFSFCLVFNSDLSCWDVSNASSMDFTFRGASLFNQNLGAWSLRTAGVNLSTIFRDSGMSTANYTDTIVGWANYVFTSGGPLNVNMTGQTAMTFDTSRSGGANFANAGAARTYLTTATPTGAGWTISGDTVI